MVRLKEIASAAGVSVMTVSKALRDKPDLAPATKARIRALADQMGYVPDLSASGLRNRTSRLFGLIIPATTDPIFARVQMAIEQNAQELGYDLLFAQSLGKPEREEAALRRMLARRVDGLFVSPVYRLAQQSPLFEDLRSRAVPTVILGHPAPFCAGFPYVETDDTSASAAATRHLIELGHTRIAYFAGPMVSPACTERLEGYRRALRDANLPQDDRLIFNAGSTVEEGAAAALQFIQESPGATAIQAASDLVAIGAANALLNQGVRIPQDLSVVGFGNILTSEFFRVPLTTIRQPKLRLGSVAMDLMMTLLRHEPVKSRRLSAELVIRASSGPPPVGSLKSEV
jgi:DNA-binding LacI/PurR family transcriptional regulator